MIPVPPPSGYAHPDYVRSLSAFGTPRSLPRSGGWFLERSIPGTPHRDGIGPYPLFACRDWSGLGADLDDLRGSLVSLTLVADPFGAYGLETLEACFDVVRPFKEHVVVDLEPGAAAVPSAHHARRVEKGLRTVVVEESPAPRTRAGEFAALYAGLAARKGLTGLRAFSGPALDGQLGLPGAVLFRALVHGEPVAAHLWFEDGAVAYSHLAASNAAGRRSLAGYALYAFALQRFRGRVRWLDLGASPGAGGPGAEDGLAWFKRGWSSARRPAYLCSRILDPEVHACLARARVDQGSDYLPAYRAGEVL